MGLKPMPVAEFYSEFLHLLSELGIEVRINKVPNEVVDAIPFDRDLISHTQRTTATTWHGFGASCCPPTMFSPIFAAPFSASRARCISSGEALISP
jgi:hypothetical protein